MLASMPVGFTVWLQIAGWSGALAVASSFERAARERQSGAIVLDPAEWNAIVVAAESDRLWPADLRAALDAKRMRHLELDESRLLARAKPDAPRDWSVAEVAARIGAQLVDVSF
jgi:hypothetical protein